MNPKYLLLLPLLFVFGRSQGQATNPNINFETGTTNFWHYYIGTCCPISTPTSTAAIPNRHTLTSGTAVDPYGGFPIISPDGGSYSLKLGNDSTGAQAEKARYYIHVPAGTSAYSLVYRYAVVFQDPGHPAGAQPRFEVNVYDSATGIAVTCAQFAYIAGAGLPGFHLYSLASQIYYKSWSTGTINLSGLGGTTVIVDFATGDCAYGAHFGYGYVDMSSGLFAISHSTCDTDSISLSAPSGFHIYTWYDSTSGAMLDTGMNVTLPNPPGPTTYMVILDPWAGYGCADTLYTQVIPSHLNVHPVSDTVVCLGSSVTLHVTATDVALPLTYAWGPAAGLGCGTCSSIIVSPTVATTYTVSVTNILGCSQTDTFTVDISTILTPGNDMVLCKGVSASLPLTASSHSLPLTYSWAPATGLSCSACAGPIANPSVSTSYTVSVTDAIGCVVRDTIKVTRDNLDILPGRDTLLCRGASVNLAANITSGTAPPITFSWFPGIGLNCSNCSSPVASPPVTTAYVVTVSDANSCTVHDTVSLSVNYVDINTAASTLMCPGAGYNLTSSISANASPVSYAWSPSAGLNCSSCASPLATPSVTTQYQLTVTDSSGCNGFAIVKVALDTIKLSHLYDTVICKDYPVTLALQATTAGSSLFYSWTPAAGLDCSNCAQPIATPQDTVVYVVHVTDDIGCSNTDSIKITIDLCNVSVPTAFTPNGDGKNDIIRVVGSLDFVRAFSFGIYNRFGQQVFYTEDIHSGWDGTLNGVAVDLGTYFYLVQYKLYNDPHILKGDFQLIR